MKLFLINLLLLLLVGITSCGPMNFQSDNSLEDTELTDVLIDATKGKTSGTDRNISLSYLMDKEENPIMDNFEAIEFYPLKSVSEDKFEYLYLKLFCEVDCEVYIHVTIEDLVIEYQWVEEKVEDPVTGEITITTSKIEINRFNDVIDLTEGGEFVKLYSNEGCAVIYSMNYTINSYSASTCFKLSITDINGNKIPYKWGIDEVQIFTSKIEENY